MKISILFWFYKNLPVCKNRLRLLRKYNPDISIFGLYGGPDTEWPLFERELSPLLDDLFPYSGEQDSRWKWRNGDLVINEWYRSRGQHLEWDSMVVVQWDELILGNIREIFSDLRKDEILLSGLRPASEVASHWHWVRQDKPENHERYLAFQNHLLSRHGYDNAILACHYLVVCLPRKFLEQYSTVESPELGMIEYRVPTYAKLFGIPFCDSGKFKSWWICAPDSRKVPWADRALVPTGPVWSQSLAYVLCQLRKPAGPRIFHPFLYVFPDQPAEVLSFLMDRQRLGGARRQFKRGLSLLKRSFNPNRWRVRGSVL